MEHAKYRVCDRYFDLHPAVDHLLWKQDDLEKNQMFIKYAIENMDVSSKYNGKYAFIRIMHCQELVSSAFSFFSGFLALFYLVRAQKLKRLSSVQKRKEHEKYFFLVESLLFVHFCTWTASGVFHMRDCYTTQCCDYIGAMSSILSLLVTNLYRLSVPLRYSCCIFGAFFILHSYYLIFVQFNFLYNSMVCGTLFLLNIILCMRLCFKISGLAHSRVLVLACLGLGFSALFQGIDFGPALFLVDSHALWHIFAFIFSSSLYLFYHFDIEYFLLKKN
ncbi:post-GPI attachment to proteins factor 3 [Nematocida sp. LUAm3]|nr:post-GPI attachment to proteins factor 3 [Nematocida sp. LUAm3]KAI5174951.1 post-GPI attachment to proteins factor 3 [Nematocida sp. LUAm2]KAI5177450.1 post-GPI attachment to proteins factor 3 [Nematocida sp. LUAm1]